jgi:hypothetical protein
MFSNPLSQFWMDLDVWGLILKGELVEIFRKKMCIFKILDWPSHSCSVARGVKIGEASLNFAILHGLTQKP